MSSRELDSSAHQAPSEVSSDEEQLIVALADVLEGIHEPCALSHGAQLGLVTAGMVESISLAKVNALSFDVLVRGLTTSVACDMYLYFEREARRGMSNIPRIVGLEFDWGFGEANLKTETAVLVSWRRAAQEAGAIWRPLLEANAGKASAVPATGRMIAFPKSLRKDA